MTARVFIDGAAGTTGLEIRERLGRRADLEVFALDDAARKDPKARAAALNEADAVILCLPDDAAREAVSMIENPDVRVIDASTAHRVHPDWTYGFAEMDAGQRARIAGAKRVANPGCYPTGFIALVRPLVEAGIVPPDYPVTVNAVSGYTGGGKQMIAQMEEAGHPDPIDAPHFLYGLPLKHKHVPEMQVHDLLARAPLFSPSVGKFPQGMIVQVGGIGGDHLHLREMQVHGKLAHPPVFSPSVGRFYRGMMVEVPLQLWALPGKPKPDDLQRTLQDAYKDEPLVQVADSAEEAGLKSLDAELLRARNDMRLFVFGNEKAGQARLVAVLDNLGKGAGGAAVQNLNIMLGLPETEGLR